MEGREESWREEKLNGVKESEMEGRKERWGNESELERRKVRWE